jgi:hypothetical protein
VAEPWLRSAACWLAVWPALPLLQQEPDCCGPEAMQEVRQLSRRAGMVAAGPATVAGGSDPRADPVVTAMQSVFRQAQRQSRAHGMTSAGSGAGRLLVY